MILILLGDGVVANVLLARSKGQNSGWIVITLGWGVAVTIAVYSVGRISGAHLNPAVTIALATIGAFPWDRVAGYVAAQMFGGFLGAVLVWLTYLPHWPLTEDAGAKLAVFCNAPAVRSPGANIMTEVIGTATLTFGVLAIGANAGGWVQAGDVDPRRYSAVRCNRCSLAFSCSGLACRSAAPRAMRSTPRAISRRAWRTPSCPLPARDPRIGRTAGFRSPRRSRAGSSAPRSIHSSASGRHMPRYVGALDQGTTSTRFMVFDAAGAEVARRQIEHTQIMPKPGWVEHDPVEIAARTNEVITGALRAANLDGQDLAAIGVTNQRETTVVWNPKTGRPWYNAIVWQDTRTDRIVSALESKRQLICERNRPAARHVLLGHEAAVDSRERRRRQGRGRTRRRDFRHDRHVGDLEPDGRRGRRNSRDRRHQRKPHAAHGSPHARLGRGAARAVRDPATYAAGYCFVVRTARVRRDAPQRARRG